MRVDHALGNAGRTRRVEDLADRLRFYARIGLVDVGGRVRQQEFGEQAGGATRGRVAAGDHFDVARQHRVDRRWNGAPSFTNTRPGVRLSMSARSLAKSLATSE